MGGWLYFSFTEKFLKTYRYGRSFKNNLCSMDLAQKRCLGEEFLTTRKLRAKNCLTAVGLTPTYQARFQNLI